jgi:hypothetical protein
MKLFVTGIIIIAVSATIGCKPPAPPPCTSTGNPSSPGNGGPAEPTKRQDQPIKGHDGRYVQTGLADFPGLVHVDVNNTDIVSSSAAKVVIKAASQTNFKVYQVFVGGFPHAVFYDSLSRTIETPWKIFLREDHSGHGIEIDSSTKPDSDKTITITTLKNSDSLDRHDNKDETVTFSLHDPQCFKKPCEKFASILVKAKPEESEYKCDPKDDKSCTILIGKR